MSYHLYPGHTRPVSAQCTHIPYVSYSPRTELSHNQEHSDEDNHSQQPVNWPLGGFDRWSGVPLLAHVQTPTYGV